jgi:hypothetical protein
LRGLVAAAEQNDENLTPVDKIEAVAWSIVDPKLADSIEEFGISQETGLHSRNSLGDLLRSTRVCKNLQPFPEMVGLADFNHM